MEDDQVSIPRSRLLTLLKAEHAEALAAYKAAQARMGEINKEIAGLRKGKAKKKEG